MVRFDSPPTQSALISVRLLSVQMVHFLGIYGQTFVQMLGCGCLICGARTCVISGVARAPALVRFLALVGVAWSCTSCSWAQASDVILQNVRGPCPPEVRPAPVGTTHWPRADGMPTLRRSVNLLRSASFARIEWGLWVGAGDWRSMLIYAGCNGFNPYRPHHDRRGNGARRSNGEARRID
jgi:hypothetical protein